MKKLFCLLLCAVMTFTLAFGSFAAFTAYGDVTGDGKVNSTDALCVLMTNVGLKNLNKDEKIAADVDANGKVNSSDALTILNFCIGKIKEFPADTFDGDPDMGHGVY